MASANELVGRVILRDMIQAGADFQLEFLVQPGVGSQLDINPASNSNGALVFVVNKAAAQKFDIGRPYFITLSSTAPVANTMLVSALVGVTSVDAKGISRHSFVAGSAINHPAHQNDISFDVHGALAAITAKVGTNMFLIISDQVPK